MAARWGFSSLKNRDTRGRKASSQGVGGRGRRIKVSTKTMNKHKKRSHKKYRGQGR